ncbi:hypothetical protein [Streptomyces sp. NBC_00690]|nr:hypothetical protein [Streptomyces sp. NBC_00690]
MGRTLPIARPILALIIWPIARSRFVRRIGSRPLRCTIARIGSLKM